MLNCFYLEIKEIKEELSILKKALAEIQQKVTPIQTTASIQPTKNWGFKPLNAKILDISTGNQGVPTDRQTDQQTHKIGELKQKDPFLEATKLITTLDSLKEEIGGLFKQLTKQELLVLTTIYQMDEEDKNCDYKTLSEYLNLSQSSIRDYIGKLTNKGVPLIKRKINNKQITLSVAESFKRTISLSNLSSFRNF